MEGMSSDIYNDATRRTRVILLLDLDCFYAQVEMVRLGLPPEWPVSLLQWDSALAVNYPARAMGIVRGDSLFQIQQKSASYCRQQQHQQQQQHNQKMTEAVALHLPIISISPSTTILEEEGPTKNDDDSSLATNNTAILNDSDCSIEAAYDKEFRLSEEKRKELFAKEKNRMRRQHEGKASLERYRLASSRIFSVILEALNDHVGKACFVLERASIDELYVDVTDHCNDDSRPVWTVCNGGGNVKDDDDDDGSQQPCSNEEVMGETVVVCASDALLNRSEERTATNDALERGCVVARMVRKAVWDELGFTLSAGISTSKTVAKLAASYGKPNGQAIVVPAAIPILMERTKVRKVRNFARKLGKKVLSLLPENEETMGAVARFLSLDRLVTGMGSEATAKFVFDACRGIDDEPVKETTHALTKSITAFKSFGGTDLVGVEQWILLLASDLAARIDLDFKRNHRYPKHCSIHYTCISKEGNKDRMARSIRVPFPTARGDTNTSVLVLRQQLATQVRAALEQKAHFPMVRLGLCAMEFEPRALNGGIGSFFSTGSHTKCTKPDSHQHAIHSIGDDTHASSSTSMTKIHTSVSNTNISRKDKKKDTGPIGAYFSTAVPVPTNHNDDPSNASLSSYTNNVEPKNIVLSESQVSPNDGEADSMRHEDVETGDEYIITKDEEMALKLQQECDREHLATQKESAMKDDHDVAYAQKLQASFDRENILLSTLERSSRNSSPKLDATGHRRSSTHKKARIDT
eukprot:CAMPEP_0198284904 /NCGR_PEP_ID=MMETSP1449-20131203/4278_1 /TAXON_ID=420275 /ORGANISM="Attheya septentrionalis, Strain CCMP2084" /LENGTH=751 /DNA_ID=CAMNT_0043982125 /DNA_START=47 /DNA_END=2299 /DNA_ORIENTATION=+